MKDSKNGILYIGKAGDLRRRVARYFIRSGNERIEKLVKKIKKVDFQKTDSALEALILESQLIKKYQPPYNVKEKDDKSFLYIVVTDDKFPRVVLVRGKGLNKEKVKQSNYFGPFTSASSVREALRIMRKVFPFSIHPPEKIIFPGGAKKIGRGCFYYQIGLCPGTCVGSISEREYKKIIKNFKLFFGGKKERIVNQMRKEMMSVSKILDFEKAEKIRRQIFALSHIQDISLIEKDEEFFSENGERIEGYDISNISGASAVGSMVVFENNKPQKNDYRKFRIKTIKESDDVGMIKEIVQRRLGNPWPLPSIFLIDGGLGQVNAAKSVLKNEGLSIPVVGIAKGVGRKANRFVGSIPKGIKKETLIKVRDEAHRFAISYHRKVRGRSFLT